MSNRDIIMDNYLHPFHREIPSNDYIKENSRNVSCIDNIDIYIKIKDNKVVDGYFEGEACAICIASSSVMLRSIIGKDLNEVKSIIYNYNEMINGNKYDENILGMSNCFNEIYKQNNRKTCALLPYMAIKNIINKDFN